MFVFWFSCFDFVVYVCFVFLLGVRTVVFKVFICACFLVLNNNKVTIIIDIFHVVDFNGFCKVKLIIGFTLACNVVSR